eukprot:CAMPEP_0206325956 /NCGR_PEP_ID=MMETSP0106_2-20121207/21352_1 /ASSEMBLY_ACC=CAM_ASM_000206 /TAXON_ID=81532 /ORGANISM="Acanthoeca-like sp., Strain 10tr" /LENGTH=100 /DNA_ID=CAMNT_0053758463 /DNA_START=103 /DNA_END=402 /DNA_ORIENTATION=+
MSPTDRAPAFMHFSGGAKLLLLDVARDGFKRRNFWSHFYRITDPAHQVYKNIQPARDIGWCTETPFLKTNIFSMPTWVQVSMDQMLDRINESLALYPVRG